MSLYLSSKQLPELVQHSPRERQEILSKAQQKLTVPEKLVLNILKLFMLTPPFLFLARQEIIALTFALIGSFTLYFFVAKPLKLHFCRKYLSTLK